MSENLPLVLNCVSCLWGRISEVLRVVSKSIKIRREILLAFEEPFLVYN